MHRLKRTTVFRCLTFLCSFCCGVTAMAQTACKRLPPPAPPRQESPADSKRNGNQPDTSVTPSGSTITPIGAIPTGAPFEGSQFQLASALALTPLQDASESTPVEMENVASDDYFLGSESIDLSSLEGLTLSPNSPAVQSLQFASDQPSMGPELKNNFTAIPEFDKGLIIVGDGIAMKIGGYVKADLIWDFDPIDSIDSFVTTSIPTDAEPRRNVRFHAKQSRLSFDTRWKIGADTAQAFVEADFFGGSDGGNGDLRLRHAYGRFKNFTAGQTWTTFTDPSAVPQTLDFEGAVSNVNRRQGLVRWDQPLAWDGLSLAVALEDPQIIIDAPPMLTGAGRTESPDFVSRLRLSRDWGNLQVAMVLRELGFQPTGERVITAGAWGFNFTGSLMLLERTRGYFQVTFGDGIGSYRGSPDVVATGPQQGSVLPMFGWMTGVHHEWSSCLTSNITISQLSLDPIPGQNPENLRDTTYFAVNLIANPYPSIFCGIEYLYGNRVDIDGDRGSANRVQTSFGFYLP
ncbi:hypothetical protein FYK55_16115 [Roseiconus nitratireducens]|uniref:Porin n=1 Tax=Roseiconus nitratireducens TaxID=2605748 RepID=A0A5M6D2L6_9BACT|nr:DcaP family trimeric outer membrane transporter [Roseiconus nitratireducens]KAA5541747.1 hypothetical protein FYK55_16115 [Roseiconus nitratireducens]